MAKLQTHKKGSDREVAQACKASMVLFALVSLMREKMDNAFEKAVKNKKNLAEIRSAIEGKPVKKQC